jgi:hypothetical protein
MRCGIITLLVAAVFVPAAAFAAAPGAATNANQDCAALKAKMGAVAFAQAYSSLGACVSHFAPVEQQNQTSANASCTALQADANFAANHSGKTFDQFYGTGKKDNNAFGRCVSTFANASSQAEQQGRTNPAQTCRALRTKMGSSAFNQLYGKNASDKNAFGKCVAQNAQAQTQNEQSSSASCRSEQSANEQAFSQKYGTNDDRSNAFGKCVSASAADKSSTQQQATVTAAKACVAEENAGKSAFMTKYGTFGHCVSLKATSK